MMNTETEEKLMTRVPASLLTWFRHRALDEKRRVYELVKEAMDDYKMCKEYDDKIKSKE